MLTSSEVEVHRYLESCKDRMVSFLQNLIRIPTQVPPGENYDRIASFLSKRLEELGCQVSIHEAPEEYLVKSGKDFLGLNGPRSNLIARHRGTRGRPVLHINGHTDVQPATPAGWSTDPFEGVVKDGHVFGRGSSDDKAELTALVFALEALRKNGPPLKGDLLLTATCDEEIGGIAGLGYLFDNHLIAADFGIELDGSADNIGIAYNGRIRYLLSSYGRAAHGQTPHLGINAIEKMSKMITALTMYWRGTLMQRGVDIPVSPSLKLDRLVAMLNIGTIKGGVQGATVPDICTSEILRCIVPRETREDAERELREILDKVKSEDIDVSYQLTEINYRDGCYISPNHPYVEEINGIIRDVIGHPLPLYGHTASCDMNYQINQGKIPCVGFGAGGPYSRGHGVDENVRISELVDLAKIVSTIILRKLA